MPMARGRRRGDRRGCGCQPPVPRIDGPRCGDLRAVEGAFSCGIRERFEGRAGGSQIAVPGGGPAMRGDLTALDPREGVAHALRYYSTAKSYELGLAHLDCIR